MTNVLTCERCGEKYMIGPEHLGATFKCRGCMVAITVPATALQPPPPPTAAAPAAAATPSRQPVTKPARPATPFDRDKFLVNQKRLSLHEQYHVFDESQAQVLFVHRPTRLLRQLGMLLGVMVTFFGLAAVTVIGGTALSDAGAAEEVVFGVVIAAAILTIALTLLVAIVLSPKRNVTFHADDTKGARAAPLLEVHQDQKFAVTHSTYTVSTPDGATLGVLQKNPLTDFFRKQWRIVGPQGELLALVKEDSLLKSLLRRFIGPLFGALRTNFIFVSPDGQRLLGEFNRKLTLFDRYVLDLTDDPGRELDRRLAVAMGVMLDTGERR